MKKSVQRSIKKSGGAKISRQRKPRSHWENPENVEQMRNALRAYLSIKPNATAEELAGAFGYKTWAGISYILRQGTGTSSKLGDLGKAQERGKHGGFRRWRRPEEKRALYKRILQEIIRNPFLSYSKLAQNMEMGRVAFDSTIRRMYYSGHMPPMFVESQRLKAVHRLKEQGLIRSEIASRLRIDRSTVAKYFNLLEKIKEFASAHKKPVEWVINRYGALIEAGFLKKTEGRGD